MVRNDLAIVPQAKGQNATTCIKECARKDPKESHSDPDCGSSTSPLQGKTSAYSCPGSYLGALEVLVGRKDGEPKALEPISELEHGFLA